MVNLFRSFFRIFFDLLYHPMAWMYDGIAAMVSFGKWTTWVRAIIPYIDGHRILELGPGTGHLQRELRLKHKLIFGLDESRQMLRVAKNRNHNLPGYLLRGRAENIPFQAESFDCVVATFPSEYIFQKETLQNIRRILNPNGMLVILLSVHFTGRQLRDLILKYLYKVTRQSSSPELMYEVLRKLFCESGFEIEFIQPKIENDELLIIRAKISGLPFS